MSSEYKYSTEVRIALRQGEGEIDEHHRKLLDLMIRDLNFSPKKAALLEDEVTLKFRRYRAELEEILKDEYPKISDASIKRLKQLQQSFELSNEDIEALTDTCLLKIKKVFDNQQTHKDLREYLLLVGGLFAAGSTVVIALPAVPVGAAVAVATAAMQGFIMLRREKNINDNNIESNQAKMKVKKKFLDENSSVEK